jgi:1-pyrroline-5-carboxylate dehydrogenase
MTLSSRTLAIARLSTKKWVTGSSRALSSSPSWATIDPKALGVDSNPHVIKNFVNGEWTTTKENLVIPCPIDRDAPPIFTVPDTKPDEIQPFLDSLRSVPKSGLHNPLKNPHRYVEYGEIARKVSSY